MCIRGKSVPTSCPSSRVGSELMGLVFVPVAWRTSKSPCLRRAGFLMHVGKAVAGTHLHRRLHCQGLMSVQLQPFSASRRADTRLEASSTVSSNVGSTSQRRAAEDDTLR